jgi:starch phosphorylase
MTVLAEGSSSTEFRGEAFHFCSTYCRHKFEASPETYVQREAGKLAEGPAGARRIAYFSMEMALASDIPTYAGGLGVLAGDTLRSCADLRVPVVGVTLLYREGFASEPKRQEGDNPNGKGPDQQDSYQVHDGSGLDHVLHPDRPRTVHDGVGGCGDR